MTDDVTKKRMEVVDRLYYSPRERASGVHSLLNDLREHLRKDNVRRGIEADHDVPSDLDLLCFAIEYTGLQAIAIGDEHFLRIAVLLNQWLYSVHYSHPAQLYGEPDKPPPDKGGTG